VLILIDVLVGYTTLIYQATVKKMIAEVISHDGEELSNVHEIT
jgi:hypothetical protein